MEAFVEGGLTLELAQVPVVLPPGARAYRRETGAATVFVVVCADLCPEQLPDLSRVVFTPEQGRAERMRRGWTFLNVFIWVTDADRRASQRLARKLQPLVNDLSRTISPDDRCYVR